MENRNRFPTKNGSFSYQKPIATGQWGVGKSNGLCRRPCEENSTTFDSGAESWERNLFWAKRIILFLFKIQDIL